jgi:hypothetical protein
MSCRERVAQAWASGTANSRIESLPTLALTRPIVPVPCSRVSTRSQGTPSSSQAMRFIAVSRVSSTQMASSSIRDPLTFRSIAASEGGAPIIAAGRPAWIERSRQV